MQIDVIVSDAYSMSADTSYSITANSLLRHRANDEALMLY